MTAPYNWHSNEDCRRTCSTGRLYLPGAFFTTGEHAVEVPGRGVNLVRCSHNSAHTDGIVLAVDGACSRNGLPNALAAVGVFVAPRSRCNVSRRLPPQPGGATASNQLAELQAGIDAVRLASDIAEGRRGHRGELRQVLVKSDSRYLVDGMTDWVFKWRETRGVNARGRCVKNWPYFLALDNEVRRLEAKGVEVLFWHVDRSENEDADELAKCALYYIDV